MDRVQASSSSTVPVASFCSVALLVIAGQLEKELKSSTADLAPDQNRVDEPFLSFFSLFFVVRDGKIQVIPLTTRWSKSATLL